jgi:hypothetical protein
LRWIDETPVRLERGTLDPALRQASIADGPNGDAGEGHGLVVAIWTVLQQRRQGQRTLSICFQFERRIQIAPQETTLTPNDCVEETRFLSVGVELLADLAPPRPHNDQRIGQNANPHDAGK